MTKIYNAPPTIAAFMQETSRVQLLLGPIGGGKTTGLLMKVLALCHAQTPTADGVRKTRWAVVRNTRPQLRDSVLKTVFDWLPPDGKRISWRESDMTLLLDLPLTDGTTVRSELLFRALDDETDARRLLSVEFTGVWFSEFREIPFQLLTDALSRTGRYPSAADGGPSWHGVIGESNMPARGSDWFRYMELERPSYTTVYKQPSGVSPQAENVANLPPDYYSTLMEGTTESWRKSHIFVEYPDSLDGKTVFAQTFQRDVHVAKEKLRAINVGPSSPCLLVGIDQGRSPAAAIGQMEPCSRLNILRELTATNMGMDKFAHDHLLPLLSSAEFAGIPVLAVLDPAGAAKGQANDVSPMDVLRSCGLRVITAPTNLIPPRLEAVERHLLRRDGLLLDPSCEYLIAALASEYKFKLKKNGEMEDKPEKLHPWSDLADALQYLCLIAGGQNLGRILQRAVYRRTSAAATAPPVRGWT